jgi:hypothetical protein
MALTDIVYRVPGGEDNHGRSGWGLQKSFRQHTKFILEVHAPSMEVFERASERQRPNFGSDEGSLTASSRGRSCSFRFKKFPSGGRME